MEKRKMESGRMWIFFVLFFGTTLAICTFSNDDKNLICRGSTSFDRFQRIPSERAKKVENVNLVNFESHGLCGLRSLPALTTLFPKLAVLKVRPRRYCTCLGG
jgi:hypothetical protein